MIYTNNREAYRQSFCTAWQKHKKGLACEPLEMKLIEVILAHPEYHAYLEKSTSHPPQEFVPEENPFIHMSLHLALRDQLHLDRPLGIKQIANQLFAKYAESHYVEHLLIQCLAQILWEAQQKGVTPNEDLYLQYLKELT